MVDTAKLEASAKDARTDEDDNTPVEVDRLDTGVVDVHMESMECGVVEEEGRQRREVKPWGAEAEVVAAGEEFLLVKRNSYYCFR